VIDNGTTDPIFVVGAPDQTPTGAQTRTVSAPAGTIAWVDAETQSSTTTIRVGDTVQWTWSGSTHGVVSGTCSGTGGGGGGYVGGGNGTYGYGQSDCRPDGLFTSGRHDGPFTYSYTFTQAGSYPYFCGVHQTMMKGRVVVNAN
jgi:plastocyanin